MKIHVTASGARRLLIVGSTLIVLGTAAVCLATPHTFSKGDLLTAADLNNLAVVANTKNGKTYSRGALFVKATPMTAPDGGAISYNGDIKGSSSNGYVNAKALCETTVGSPSAHMCTGDELVRSEQLGITVPNGWYAAGAWHYNPSGEGTCSGWISSNSSDSGSYWNNGAPGSASCAAGSRVLCCD